MNQTEFVIQQRMKLYDEDIIAVREHAERHPDIPLETARIETDKAIWRELNRILTGEDLERIG